MESVRNPGADLEIVNTAFKNLHEQQLRFLSKADAQTGLTAFARDINLRFSPENTAILLCGYSSGFFYRFLKDKIKNFQAVQYQTDKQALVSYEDKISPIDPSKFDNIAFVDDWVLTATQLSRSVLSKIVPTAKIRPYFLVMSDTGIDFCRQNQINARCMFTIDLLDTDRRFKTSGFGGYPIYGFHKIPDMIPEAYASSVHNGAMSIFPRLNDQFIGRNSRLQNEI